jgi:hypothetical protein
MLRPPSSDEFAEEIGRLKEYIAGDDILVKLNIQTMKEQGERIADLEGAIREAPCPERESDGPTAICYCEGAWLKRDLVGVDCWKRQALTHNEQEE